MTDCNPVRETMHNLRSRIACDDHTRQGKDLSITIQKHKKVLKRADFSCIFTTNKFYG